MSTNNTSGEVVQHDEYYRPQCETKIWTDMHASDFDRYRSIENGSTDKHDRDAGKKQFGVLPEAKHHQVMDVVANASMDLTEANNSLEILQSIQLSEQRKF